MNPVAVAEFASQIAAAVHPIPLILKVGLFKSVEQMRAVFLAAARASAAGISGLNSVSMEVAAKTGGPALGALRRTSGVCGGAIRDDALRFMRDAAKIRQEEKLDLALLGCGGLMQPEDLEEMLFAGADIAMTATRMMWNPLLAIRYREMAHAHR
jgi:dihydroorotate dehydrogenase